MINGIVLRKIDYKETSYILNILTEDGYETLFNNGVKKKNSNKLAISEPITLISYIRSEGRYKTLKEGTVINEFKNIKENIEILSIASVMTEYVILLEDANIGDKKLYNLFKNSLEELNQKEIDGELTLFRFELILLNYIGISPRKEHLIETYNANEELINSLTSIMNNESSINRSLLREFFKNYYEREGGIVLKSKKLYLDLVR